MSEFYTQYLGIKVRPVFLGGLNLKLDLKMTGKGVKHLAQSNKQLKVIATVARTQGGCGFACASRQATLVRAGASVSGARLPASVKTNTPSSIGARRIIFLSSL